MAYHSKVKKTNNKSPLDKWMTKSAEKVDDNVNKKWFSEEERGENPYVEFLSDKEKLDDVVPPKLDKPTSTYPDKLIDFDTSYGVISVGADKYKDDEELVFTILPEGTKEKPFINEANPYDKDTYLGSVDDRHDDFEKSDLSFKYDFASSKFDRIDDVDDKVDKEDELLYGYDSEDEEIKLLNESKNQVVGKKSRGVDTALRDINDVKEVKRKANLDFFKDIDKIVRSIEKGKIQKMVESEDAISRRDRIRDMSMNNVLLEEIRFLLKKIKESELDEYFVQKVESLNLKLLNGEQLMKIIDKLRGLCDSS